MCSVQMLGAMCAFLKAFQTTKRNIQPTNNQEDFSFIFQSISSPFAFAFESHSHSDDSAHALQHHQSTSLVHHVVVLFAVGVEHARRTPVFKFARARLDQIAGRPDQVSRSRKYSFCHPNPAGMCIEHHETQRTRTDLVYAGALAGRVLLLGSDQKRNARTQGMVGTMY